MFGWGTNSFPYLELSKERQVGFDGCWKRVRGVPEKNERGSAAFVRHMGNPRNRGRTVSSSDSIASNFLHDKMELPKPYSVSSWDTRGWMKNRIQKIEDFLQNNIMFNVLIDSLEVLCLLWTKLLRVTGYLLYLSTPQLNNFPKSYILKYDAFKSSV